MMMMLMMLLMTTVFLDEQVGRVLAALHETRLDERAAVLLMSDHGVHLGEHGFFEKANLHERVARVPLIVAPPTAPPLCGAAASWARAAGRVVASPVELVDVVATVSALAGVRPPNSSLGRDLSALLEDDDSRASSSSSSFTTSAPRDYALAFTATGTLLRSERFAYMRYHRARSAGDGVGAPRQEELYEMARDPDQLENLAAAGGAPARSDGRLLLAEARGQLCHALLRLQREQPIGTLEAVLEELIEDGGVGTCPKLLPILDSGPRRAIYS